MTEFEKLFNENYDFIFRYLLKLAGDTSLAEELPQETFFRAYINFSSLRDKAKARAWLCTIAKNTYFSWYNEQKKNKRIPLSENESDVESIEDAFVYKELSREAMKQMLKLDEPYKDVLMLSVFEGFSLKEISTLFGKSESRAWVTFYRAKQKLSEKMR